MQRLILPSRSTMRALPRPAMVATRSSSWPGRRCGGGNRTHRSDAYGRIRGARKGACRGRWEPWTAPGPGEGAWREVLAIEGLIRVAINGYSVSVIEGCVKAL